MQIHAYNNLATSAFSAARKGIEADNNAVSGNARQAAELDTSFGAILKKAMIEPDGRDAVAAAKLALADGSLQSEQAYADAADNMLDLGI